eukprot:171541_1
MSNKSKYPGRKKYICILPFNQWAISALLNELKEAKDRSKYRIALFKAMKGIAAFPSTIDHRTITNKKVYGPIDGVGATIAPVVQKAYIENAQSLIKHGKQYREKASNDPNPHTGEFIPHRKKRKTPRVGVYIPERMSGSWATICSLASKIGEPFRIIEFTKQDIIDMASVLSTHSFVAQNQGYTAWSSVKLIEEKYLNVKHNKNKQDTFSLTKKAYDVAKKLIKLEQRLQTQTQKSYTNNENTNNSNSSPPTTPITNKTKLIINRKRKNNNKPLSDITCDINNYSSPPPIKKRKLDNNYNSENKSRDPHAWYGFFKWLTYGGLYTPITRRLDLEYNLRDEFRIGNKMYRFFLNIDSREKGRSDSKQIDIFKNLKDEKKIYVSQLELSCGDFAGLLQECETGDFYILPKIIERKTWADLDSSISDGRYKKQKLRMDWVTRDDKENKIIPGGRKIYLLEDYIKKDVIDDNIERVFKASISTECRDGYLVYYTQSKEDTQRTLINWAYLMREWIDYCGFNMNMAAKLSLFNEFTPKRFELIDDKIERKRMMGKLLHVPGCTEKDAFYITSEYKCMRDLYNGWDKCIEKRDMIMDEKKRNMYEPGKMLHRRVNVYADWKFKADLLKTKLLDGNVDSDIESCLFELRNSGYNDEEKGMSEALSENIYKAFYIEELVKLEIIQEKDA